MSSENEVDAVTLTYDPHDRAWPVEGVPFDHLAKVRAEQPVCPTPAGAWYLSRQSDVQTVLKDIGTFYADLGPMTGVSGVEVIPDDQLFLSEIPEPRHTKLRRIFNACFGPQRVKDMGPFLRATCDHLLDAMLAEEVPDLHTGYAMPIPGLSMAQVLDIPPSAADLFNEWSFDGSLLSRPVTPGVAPGRPAVQEYFVELLTEQRALPTPTNHVVGLFLAAEIDGEPLGDQEIATQLHFMIQAGVHTTRGLLVHAVQRLMEPALFISLQADPSQIPTFVEEVLRHDSPAQRVTRRCAHQTTLAGIEMDTGTWLEVGIASANRDESVYEDPEEFRLDRPDPRGHLGFGGGPHVCPGATLARAETVTAVEVLCERLASITPVPGATYPPIPGSLSHQAVPAILRRR